MIMTERIEQFRGLVTEAIANGQNGMTRACKTALHEIYSHIKNDPFILWEDSFLSQQF